jgi:hypothetical protein
MATFGNTSAAGNSDWLNGDQPGITEFTSPSDAGTLTAISLYVNNAATPINVKFVLYNTSGTLLASSAAVSLNATGFVAGSVSYALSPSTTYIFGIIPQSNVGASCAFDWRSSGGTSTKSYLSAAGGSYASPGNLTLNAANTSYGLTVIATYTPVSGLMPKTFGARQAVNRASTY